MKSFLPVGVLLMVCCVLGQDSHSQFENSVLNAITLILEDDDFKSVSVSLINNRKKRSSGVFGGFGTRGNNYVGNYLNSGMFGYDGNYGNDVNLGYGTYNGRSNVNFIQCFKSGRVHIENNNVVHNYYQQGSYQKALQYFNALPLVKVAKVSNGYVGHFQKRRSYTVNVCDKCNRGYPQIEVRCNSKPYNYLVRRFAFQPQINNVNYNNYNNYNLEQPTYYAQEYPAYQVQGHHGYQGYQGYGSGYTNGGQLDYLPADSGYIDNNFHTNKANFAPGGLLK